MKKTIPEEDDTESESKAGTVGWGTEKNKYGLLAKHQYQKMEISSIERLHQENKKFLKLRAMVEKEKKPTYPKSLGNDADYIQKNRQSIEKYKKILEGKPSRVKVDLS